MALRKVQGMVVVMVVVVIVEVSMNNIADGRPGTYRLGVPFSDSAIGQNDSLSRQVHF